MHRLDKGTSGVMVVAKTDVTHNSLTEQFSGRQVAKQYLALAYMHIETTEGVFNSPIGRHPSARTKMAGRVALKPNSKSREAETQWKVTRRWPGFSLVELTPKTGRTHQLRVHLSEAGWPIVGDITYSGGPKRMPEAVSKTPLGAAIRKFERPALHAAFIDFKHPTSNEKVKFTAPLAQDMVDLIALIDKTLKQEPIS